MTYRTLVTELRDRLRRDGVDVDRDALAEATGRSAALHPEITALESPQARLEAARRAFFADVDSTDVTVADDGPQFSVYACPVADMAIEFRDMCSAARSLLGAVTGDPIEQSEWLCRGDWRCTFLVREKPCRP